MPALAATVTRGPYLQQGTPTSVIVRWRTDVPTYGEVRYGTSPAALGSSVSESASTTEHQVALAGLLPNKKYYYSVGTTLETLAGDSSYFFVTPVPVGTKHATRIWAIGDAGTADANQKAVRDAYAAYTGNRYTDVWLMLGDNAYENGTDTDYRNAVFDIYDAVTPASRPARFLRQTVLWPTIGNHDTAQSTSPPPTLPYYKIFTLPTNGEAGGLASGTENYYSFDVANIHFVCLDSMTESRSTSGPMLTWLASDLASTTQEWIIAFWHHPPYSKGGHNSDTETELRQMRQNALPVLESYGVDLVLTGHSHSYERSFLIDGHYGNSSSFDPATMAKDSGDGRVDGTGAYKKPTEGPGPREGAVYVVNGNSGQVCSIDCGTLDHPAMYVSFGQEAGSMVIDVAGNRLDATYLRRDGLRHDHFTIVKGVPTASINDVATVEGNSGIRTALFTVSLSNPPVGGSATVSYATADGTATAGSDYTAASGTLTFPAGVTTRTIPVPVKGDFVSEGNETLFIELGNSTNAVVGDGQGQGTITDDDEVGVFELGSASYSVSEAAAAATLIVKRSGTAAGGAVDYSTSDGTALAGSDYSPASGTLTFAPGVISRTVTVPILHDTAHEPNETALIRLANPTGPGSALGPRTTAVVTILDNDPVPLLQFTAATYAVKEAGGAARATVRRVGSTGGQATVDYATKDGTATAGADYTPTSGTLTFGPGVATQAIAVPIADDTSPETSEAFEVGLSNAQPAGGAGLGNVKAANVTITDDDQGLQFSSSSYTVAENALKAVISVKRTGGTAGALTVDYAATGGTATNGSDYSLPAGTLTFGPGQAIRTFAVIVLNDTLVEGSETVNLALSGFNPPATQGAPASASLTILDTEPVFQFSAGKYAVAESAAKVVITVKRTGSTASAASVDYTVSDGTAQSSGDYTSPSTGTLTVGTGKSTQTLSIGIINDTEDEVGETVTLGLQNPSAGYGIGTPGAAVMTINDNDTAGKAQFSAGAYSVLESAGLVTITVTRTGGIAGMATVAYATTPGPVNPGVPGVDYESASGTLTFGPGETSQSFDVVVVDDLVADASRSVTLTLGPPGGGLTLGTQNPAILWLVDDE